MANSAAFCPDCGSIFPPIRDIGSVVCYACSGSFEPEKLFAENAAMEYTIDFNLQSTKSKQLDKASSEKEEEGPVVDRKCPKCGNEKMSYATLQLRSADEGQTVFYTCTKCSFKESENS